MTLPPSNLPAGGDPPARPVAGDLLAPERGRGTVGSPRSFPPVRIFGRRRGTGLIRPPSEPEESRPRTLGEPSRREARLVHALQLTSSIAAAVVIVGGALVLLGWRFDLQHLRAIGPVDVVMNPLSALLFVLTGSVLLLDRRRGRLERAWAVACGLVIAVGGMLVLMRSIAGWQVGVDEWLFRGKVLSVDPPDWMAGNAALNFVLLGLALLSRRVRGRGGWRPAHWLVLPVALMSLLVVIGYLYGAAGFITFQLQLPMALNTAFFFLLACFALVAGHPNEGVMTLFVSDSAGGAITRRLLPALLLVPLVLGSLVDLGMRSGWYGPTAGLALLTLATIVMSVLLVVTTAGALHHSDLALRRSEEHFRALIENASDYVMILDRAGAIQYVSPSVERILGYRPEEMLGGGTERMVHPDDLATVYRAMEKVFEHPGDVFRAEFRIRHRDGSWRVFENVARTLRADSGAAGAVANARDITDRRRAEDEIARQKSYFEDILDSLDAGIVVFDSTGRFEYASASALVEPDLRNWVIGRTIEDYGRAKNLPRDVIEVRQRGLEQAIRTGAPVQFEQEIRRADGTRQMLRRMVPLLDEAGDLERIVAFSVDITDRKEAEVALEEAKQEAERANRAKSEFLSRMSHELRTPLNAILGFAQVLERSGLPAEQEKHLEHILKGGKHLLGLINEVLDLSRIESGRLALTLEPVAVSAVIREAMDLVRPLANEAGTRLVFDDGAAPEASALADHQRLTQVLINLLSNAIKYDRMGGPVRILAEAAGCNIVIRVQDSGPGIPEERLGQLFTPFARLGAEQTETEGTGLGLALSRRLTEAMGGHLVLEETGPTGSTFRLELPLGSGIRAVSAGIDGPPGGGPEEPGGAATILYIEDNRTNLSLVEAVLESKPSWTTISALRGEAGIELARERKPDLILLDLHLPDIPGDEVLDRLRRDPVTANIPVVVISADATAAARTRLRAAGARDYLTKPLDLDEFMTVVERFVPGGAHESPR
jgi:PAS domain S-box-containing protein